MSSARTSTPSVATLAILALAVGCSRGGMIPSPAPDAGVAVTACFTDSDCPDPQLFACSPSTFTCQPSCRVAADCNASHRGAFPLPYCDGPLGCQCDQGQCVKALCSSDTQCASGVCRNGECVAPTAVTAVARCSLAPSEAVLREGTVRRFTVLAEDGSGDAVVPTDGQVGWAADGGVSLPADAGAPMIEVLASAANPGKPAAVLATVGTARCAASVRILPATVPAGQVRAVISDALTGRALDNVQVVLTSDGSDAGTEPVATGNTNQDGVALLPVGDLSGPFSLSAFRDGYGYLTIAGADLTGSRDFRMVLRRDPALHGGFSGTFEDVPASDFVHLGLAGLSPLDPVMDVTPRRLFGATAPAPLLLGATVQQQAFQMPDGLFVGAGMSASKPLVRAEGDPGVCSDPPAGEGSAEQASVDGRCGTAAGWALSTDVPLGALPLDLLGADPSQLSYVALLGRGAPLLRGLNSTVRRDVEYGLVASGADVPDGGTLSRGAGFSPTFSVPPNVPAAIAFVVDVPALPSFGGHPVEGVALLGEALVPGRGQVPLGLGGAVSTTGHSLPDLQPGMSRQGLVPLRMAPTHHGLEGSTYLIQAMAVQLKRDATVGLVASALVARPPANTLQFDPAGTSPIPLGQAFLPLASHAEYLPLGGDAAPPRTVQVTIDPTAATATAALVTFTTAQGTSWTVIADPGRLASGLRLPVAPGGFEDRTLFDASGAPADLAARLVSLDARPATSDAPLDFRMAVENTGTNFDRVNALLRAYSVVEFPHPQIAFVMPQDGAAVGSTITATVQVRGFALGQGNAVLFQGCGQAVSVSTDPSLGRGLVAATLDGCSGAVELSATLLRDGTPLSPSASASVHLTVQ